jgi:hypothetical protein
MATNRAHTLRNLKRPCIMLYAKPREHYSAVATLSIGILLSARIKSSTPCTVAFVAISTGRPGRISATFEVLERNFGFGCGVLYMTNNSNRKKETFLHEYSFE